MNQDLVPGMHLAVVNVLEYLRPEAAGDRSTGMGLVPPEHFRAQTGETEEKPDHDQRDGAHAHPAKHSIFGGS